MSSPFRSHAFLKLAVLAVVSAIPAIAWSQAAPPASAPAAPPAMTPAAPPTLSVSPAAPTPAPEPTLLPPANTSAPAPLTITPPASATAAGTAETLSVTQPFVASISADKVYVRSGPGTAYYEMGQLAKGDLVYVVGASRGWYQILPPNGTFCMIAKDLVDADVNAAGTGTAIVKNDYVNLRAGTAVNKNRDPSAVLTVLRKGAKLKVIGTTDKYFQVAPTDQSYVFVSPQFVKQAPGVAYKVPDLKLPAGATAPAVATVEAPAAAPPLAGAGTPPAAPAANPPATPTIEPAPGTTAAAPTLLPGTGTPPPTASTVTAPPVQPLPPLVPKVVYSDTATARFKDANARYQDELKKPPAQQQVEPLLKEFQDLLTLENLSPSVKAGAEADIAAIQRTMSVQRLVQEQATADELTRKQSDALREQYESAERAIAAARTAGPYSAEGVLQTSTIVQGKYALVNPQTGRVVAYVDPATASIDIGSLVGKYVGVRGMSKKMPDSDITVIQVSNATLQPPPGPAPK